MPDPNTWDAPWLAYASGLTRVAPLATITDHDGKLLLRANGGKAEVVAFDDARTDAGGNDGLRRPYGIAARGARALMDCGGGHSGDVAKQIVTHFTLVMRACAAFGADNV